MACPSWRPQSCFPNARRSPRTSSHPSGTFTGQTPRWLGDMPKHSLRKTNQHCLNDCSRKLEGEANSFAGRRPRSGERSSILCLCSSRPTGGRAMSTTSLPSGRAESAAPPGQQAGQCLCHAGLSCVNCCLLSLGLLMNSPLSDSWQPKEQWTRDRAAEAGRESEKRESTFHPKDPKSALAGPQKN